MSESGPLDVVLQQIRDAKAELDNYAPDGVDWFQRSVESAGSLVPWLQRESRGLSQNVEVVMNAPQRLSELWREVRQVATLPKELVMEMKGALARVRFSKSGETISNVMEDYLIENHPDRSLESNGKSDYPDLFLRSNDYSSLPKFVRKTKDYGASLKGENQRPVRVPDGLEIKTCRDRFAVDCHHAHVGLHLVLVFQVGGGGMTEVADVMIAFMRKENYRITKSSTSATTPKASLNADNFISLLQ